MTVDLKKLLTKLLQQVNSIPAAPNDYVTDQGTITVATGRVWRYRKWNSGISEAWVTITQTGTTMNNSSSGLYRSDVVSIGAAPSGVFIAMPTYTVSAHSATNNCMIPHNANGYSLTSLGDVCVWRGNSNATSMTIYYDIYCVGRWK